MDDLETKGVVVEHNPTTGVTVVTVTPDHDPNQDEKAKDDIDPVVE